MEQAHLFQEDTRHLDAARSDVEAAGGLQIVGHKLWPHLDPVEAGKKLGNALNPKQKQKLEYADFQLIKKLARGAASKSQLHALESAELNCDLHWITRDEEVQRTLKGLSEIAEMFQAQMNRAYKLLGESK